MPTYENMTEAYQSCLNKACDADERALNMERRGQTQEARNAYNEAAGAYAKAAEMLLDIFETFGRGDDDNYKRSIDRLVAAAGEMRSRAAALDTKKDIRSSSVSGDGEDETVFRPLSETPNVHFSDIAGLADAKELVMDKIINPILYPDIYDTFKNKHKGGLLLYGPPGGGKTMMARAIAAESGLPFFSIRCSDIVSKYFGEAEKRVRDLFKCAREAGNAVVFLDEAEALASRRGSNSTVMARLVPELLAQMDGFDEFDGHLIVVLATNRPYDIDPAFLRPGRMAALCYVPLPDEEVRLSLLRQQLSERPCREGIDCEKLARETERFSCADLVNLIDNAAQYPINRCIVRRRENQPDTEDFITQEDIDNARAKLFPSVEQKEIERLEKWRGGYLTA